MTAPPDRRSFLRRLAAVGLAGPTVPLLGCMDADPDTSAEGVPAAEPSPGPLAPVTRPVLVPYPPDRVTIVTPQVEMPMAYVSMARREVYVDFDYRDRARFMLHAHISVSTGLWRMPLPGDPEKRPIQPGDSLREFEEFDIATWEPTLPPAEGDFRLRRGAPAPVTIDFDCIPMQATGAWLSGGPWTVLRCDGAGEESCREDFVEVGVGTSQPIRGCADPGIEVRFLTWAHVEGEG